MDIPVLAQKHLKHMLPLPVIVEKVIDDIGKAGVIMPSILENRVNIYSLLPNQGILYFVQLVIGIGSVDTVG